MDLKLKWNFLKHRITKSNNVVILLNGQIILIVVIDVLTAITNAVIIKLLTITTSNTKIKL